MLRKFLFILVVLPAGAVLADSGAGTQSLEPLVVSATRWEQADVPAAGSIAIISREQIEQSGALNVADALRGQGGVQVSDEFGDGSRTVVSMRGFGANAPANTLILVDGRRLNNTDLAAPDLSSISLKDVQRIEVIQGSAGTLYGDEAVGGVINIITRRPVGFEASAAAGYGSYDRQMQRGAVADRYANGLGFRVSVEHVRSDNYRERNRKRYANGFAHIDYAYHGGRVFIEHEHVEENLQLPGGLFADQLAADRRQARYPHDFNDTSTDVSRLGLRQRLGSDWHLQAEFSNRYSAIGGRLTNVPLTQRRHIRTFNPRLIGEIPLSAGKLLVTAGADLEYSDYGLGTSFGQTNNAQDAQSLYAQVVLPLTQAFVLTAGTRKAWVHNHLVDSGAFGVFPNGVNLNDHVWVSTLGISAALAPGWRMFLRRDENYRFPLADEQTLTPPGVVGLRTQTGVSYEAGLEWAAKRYSARLVGYRLLLHNEIDFDPAAGLFGANTNLDRTLRTGVIAQASAQVTDALRLAAQYTFVNAKFDSGAFAGNDVPFVARQQLHLSADYRFSDHWGLYTELQAISRRYASGDFANALAQLPGYAVVNMNLRYRRAGWLVEARVNNVLDKRYSDYAATNFNFTTFATETGFYPAPERNVQLTVSYAFD